MSEQNKLLMRRGIEEVWNRGDFAVVDDLIASDFVARASAPVGEIHGPEGVKQYFGTLREAFPDLHFTIEDQIAEGDRVVARWVAHGTHTGTFQGIPATSRQVRVTGITINRLADGKVVQGWMSVDMLGLLQQLGVVPAPTPAGNAQAPKR